MKKLITLVLEAETPKAFDEKKCLDNDYIRDDIWMRLDDSRNYYRIKRFDIEEIKEEIQNGSI